MNANPYDNVYLDRDGIVKPIVTSPAKSRDEIQVARVKQLKHRVTITASSSDEQHHDDVAFQRINRFVLGTITQHVISLQQEIKPSNS